MGIEANSGAAAPSPPPAQDEGSAASTTGRRARASTTPAATLIINAVLLMGAIVAVALWGQSWLRDISPTWVRANESYEGLASFPPSNPGLRPILAYFAVQALLGLLVALAALQVLMLLVARWNGPPSVAFMAIAQMLVVMAGLFYVEWGMQIRIGPFRGSNAMYPHPTRHWSFNPYADAARYYSDSHGLKGIDDPGPRQPGEFRILCLGDSISAGNDLPEKYTYEFVMRGDLQRRFPGRLWRVKNGAVNGYSIQQNVAVLEELYDIWKPDLIVAEFTHANAEIVQMYEGGVMRYDAFKWLRRQLFKSDFYLWLRREINYSSTSVDAAAARKAPGVDWQNDPKVMYAGLDRLCAFVRAHDLKVVFYLPFLLDHRGQHHQDVVGMYAAEHGYPSIDIQAKWDNVSNITELLQDTHHPNIPGCVMQARDLEDALVQLKLIPTAPATGK